MSKPLLPLSPDDGQFSVGALWIERLRPAHFDALCLQASQRLQLGEVCQISEQEAEDLCDQDEAWACVYDGRLVALVGIRETFPGRQGVAWAMLAQAIGGAHLSITRFARWRIGMSALRRLEVIAKCGDAEAIIAASPRLARDTWFLIDKLARSTPDCIWAGLLGFAPVHVLRHYGGASETHMLFELIV